MTQYTQIDFAHFAATENIKDIVSSEYSCWALTSAGKLWKLNITDKKSEEVKLPEDMTC